MMSKMCSDDEAWKPVKNFPRYYVSNLGNIRYGSTLLKPYNYGGNLYINAMNDKQIRKKLTIARVVAEQFVDNVYNCQTIVYKDGNKLNCRADNLRYGDSLCSVYTLDDELVTVGTYKEISKLLNCNKASICKSIDSGKKFKKMYTLYSVKCTDDEYGGLK